MTTRNQVKIAVIGLGYVGLPLAHAFSKQFEVTGFDISAHKIEQYKAGIDVTAEIGNEKLAASSIKFTSDISDIRSCNFYIVAVPTPINKDKTPNLEPLKAATRSVAGLLNKGDYVVYESTVYPGLTEEFCLPMLEKGSGLKCGEDFKIGYSPERINPGDKVHAFENITKVVSGCDNEALVGIAEIYTAVVRAGVYKASSIRVAEAAKVIENAQRDINIAFVNELSLIFNKLGISTKEVLEAAGTKWNFLNFTPGLVGGHCIGVDPYYLAYKAESIGHRPEVIMSGRRINDEMGKYVAENAVKMLIHQDKKVKNTNALILGFTFKENVPDIRNTKVVDIYSKLLEYGVNVDIYDPVADSDAMALEYGIIPIDAIPEAKYDAVIYAVPHDAFSSMTMDEISNMYRGKSKIFLDVKNRFNRTNMQKSGFMYWAL
ncbi:MAG: nucleotide sugar dehydrogenase [Clostridiales bacterium]|nr:nucleotide sugar dehydrogenase [Clostridiales bacterium]